MDYKDHPVDILKEFMQMDETTEKELRAICDQPVCSSCGSPIWEWSKTPPMVPGYYWFRDGEGAEEMTQILFYDGDRSTVYFMGSDETSILGDMRGEWAGPITPPK